MFFLLSTSVLAQDTLDCTGLEATCELINEAAPAANTLFSTPLFDEGSTRAGRRPSTLYNQLDPVRTALLDVGCEVEGWAGGRIQRTDVSGLWAPTSGGTVGVLEATIDAGARTLQGTYDGDTTGALGSERSRFEFNGWVWTSREDGFVVARFVRRNQHVGAFVGLQGSCPSWVDGAAVVADLTDDTFRPIEATCYDVDTYYPFDEGEGVTAADVAGSVHGTLQGSPTWVDGIDGSALDFSESGSVAVDVPGTYEQLTLAAWVQRDLTGSGLRVLLNSDGFQTGDVHWQLTTGDRIHFTVNHASCGNDVTSSGGITDEHWHHVATTWDDATGAVRFYIDGVLDSSGSFGCSEAASIGAAHIGRWNGSNRAFDGVIDGMVIDGSVWSDDAILDLYTDGLVICEP